MKRKNEVGNKYTRLFVESFAGSQKTKYGSKTLWNCICDCGEQVVADGACLRNGSIKSCGCLRKELSSQRRQVDLVGQRFTKLLVLEKAYTKNYAVYWKCLCDCGNICYVTTQRLRYGTTKSCGCIMKDIMGPKLYKDITGMRSGRLVAIEPTDQRMHRQVLWRCKCDCGGETLATTTDFINGHIMSCGCLNSKGEEQIAAYLTSKEIKYKKGYNFKDLFLNGDSHRGRLKFDFGILGDNKKLLCLIEFQGIQHYMEVSRHGFGDQQRLITDPMKREYCKTHNIPLYEIRYDANIEEEINKIIHTHVNPVGNEELAS